MTQPREDCGHDDDDDDDEVEPKQSHRPLFERWWIINRVQQHNLGPSIVDDCETQSVGTINQRDSTRLARKVSVSAFETTLAANTDDELPAAFEQRQTRPAPYCCSINFHSRVVVSLTSLWRGVQFLNY